MAAGTYIPESVDDQIRKIFLKNDALKPKEIWYELQKQLGTGARIPSLSYVQYFCREKLFPKYAEMKATGLDDPWHIGLMRQPEYGCVSPEAARYISVVQAFCNSYLKPPINEKYPPITARQALWISRLYQVVLWKYGPDIGFIKKNEDRDKALYELWQWSNAYAEYEIICDLSGTAFDTQELDRAIREGKVPEVIRVLKDGEPIADHKSIVLFGRNKQGQKTIGMVPPHISKRTVK